MIILARFAPFFLANALFRICAFALIIVFLDWWSVIPFALLLLLNLVHYYHKYGIILIMRRLS